MANHGQYDEPSINNNGNLPPPTFPTNEEDGIIARNNEQHFSESSSASRGGYITGQELGGGFIMNKGGAAGASGGEQRIPASYQFGMFNDIDSQPASGSIYPDFGPYTNYSGPGHGGMGMRNFKGDDESINYLAARAHAAQMLAAEESRRLEENLMMLEMRRRMMMMGGAGSGMMDGSANQAQGSSSGYQTQGSSNSSAGMSSNVNDNDSILMARGQKFNISQNQMNMMDSNTNNVPHQSSSMDFNWNNGSNFSPSNIPPPFGSGEAMKSPGEYVAGRIPQPRPSTASADSPRPYKRKATPAPRRPLSAYNIFFSEMREAILMGKDDADEAESKEDLTEDSAKADNDNDKKLPQKPVGQEKAQQPKDMEAFTQNLMKKRLDKNPQKRVHRKSHGKVAFTTLAKTVGQRWRELPEEKKKKYKDLAEIDRERYRNEKLAAEKVCKEEAKKQRKEAKTSEIIM